MAYHASHEGRVSASWDLDIFRPIDVEAPRSQMDDLKVLARGGDVAPVPGDFMMWEFLRFSLETCLRYHPMCREQQDITWFPERLLSIRRGHDGCAVIRLIQTQRQRPHSAYIALSHCWGSGSFLCTTSKNIESHEAEIHYSKLPYTFQDAITVALEMGVSYIWIDSLCIVQDLEDDWARHAEMMDKIYENALFVAAAVSSSDSSVQFLGPDAPTQRYIYRTIRIDAPAKDHSGPSDSVPVIGVRYHEFWLDPTCVRGPLEDRAWALQERYCATRIIDFTMDEAKWQCKVAVGCECFGGLIKNDKTGLQALDNNKPKWILGEWRDVCQRYSSRDLTYKSDRLPALAGIAARFHAKLGTSYIAGLWEADMPFNLGWLREWRGPTLDMIAPAMDNGTPSWSWASIFGSCYWSEYSYPAPPDQISPIDQVSNVEITQINCNPSTKNAFGAVKAGSFIELQGSVVSATMECDMYGRAKVSREGSKPQAVVLDCKTISVTISTNGELYRTMRRDTGSDSGKQSKTSGVEDNVDERDYGRVLCMLFYTTTATRDRSTQVCVLVLGELSGDDKSHYQRLGIGRGQFNDRYDQLNSFSGFWRGWEDHEEWQEWKRWFADAEVKTLRIV
jgi:hypothetical protein